MSEADRRREDSVYFREGEEPDRLLRDLADAPVLSEQQINRGAKGSHQGNLTASELDVVKLMAHGYDTRMMASQLELSRETIKSQIKSAKAAMNAKTQPHLVAIALRAGLIE